MDNWLFGLLDATFRSATPLLFATMGGLMSERAGVVNIALEGKMLLGALAAAVLAHYSQSAWVGAGGALFVGCILGAIYGLFVIPLKTNQIVAGTALNLFALGLSPLLTNWLFDTSGASPSLPLEARFVILPTLCVWPIVLLIYLWSRFTPSGLWHYLAGEHPTALSAQGVSPVRARWWGVTLAGGLAALGGASLSIYLASSFTRNMTAGRGFMALAALILGKWHPLLAAAACVLYALAEALQLRGDSVPFVAHIPDAIMQVFPYLLTLGILAGLVGNSRPPKALGRTIT